MKVFVLSFVAGGFIGLIFKWLKLPLPAPPPAGLLGLAGMLAGGYTLHWLVGLLGAGALLGSGPAPAAPANAPAGASFAHHYAQANGVRLHYVTAGQGEPVVLLAGWPQTWYAWRKVIPLLAERYFVVALDMRGLGDSEKPQSGYDTLTVARDIRELVRQLGFSRIRLAGHDVGAWVGYSFAAAFPETVSHLVLLDAAIPGIAPDSVFQLSRSSTTWQFFFHPVPDLPEQLTAGRERLYLSWFFRTKAADPSAIGADALDEYVRCYSAPGAMAAGFAYYRAVFDDIPVNREFAKTKLKMPVMTLGGEKATGTAMLHALHPVAERLTGGAIAGSGHYIPEERPQELAGRLLSFFATQ